MAVVGVYLQMRMGRGLCVPREGAEEGSLHVCGISVYL